MMGFDQYGAYGYNPYQMYQSMQTQSVQQTLQPPQNNGVDVAYVSDVQQVERLQLAAGQKRIVIVQNEPVIAMRSADQMGLVNTDYYRLEKIDINNQQTTTAGPDYVTREQMEARIAELCAQLQAITGDEAK